MDVLAVGGEFDWGGDLDGRQARLDAAMAEAERRHQGLDGGRHHWDNPPPRRAARPHCNCGCEDQPDGDDLLEGARAGNARLALLYVEFRAVSP